MATRKTGAKGTAIRVEGPRGNGGKAARSVAVAGSGGVGRDTPTYRRAARTSARSTAIADAGVKTGADFARVMSLLMGDILAGRVDCKTANACCNAGGRLLKAVELQQKYGVKASEMGNRLSLTD